MSNPNNVSATSSLEPTPISQEPIPTSQEPTPPSQEPTSQFPKSGLVRGASCRLLPTHPAPAPTRSRERIVRSQGPALTSLREPTTGSSKHPNSGPTADFFQKLVTKSRGELNSTKENKHFFTQLHKHDMRVNDNLPLQVRQESREPTSIPTMESRHFFSQPQIRDMSFDTFQSLLAAQKSAQQEEPTRFPQATIPSNSQPLAEQNAPRQQEASGMGPDTPALRSNRPESHQTQELRNPTLHPLVGNIGAVEPLRQATAQQIRRLNVQMQREAEAEAWQNLRRLRRETPTVITQLDREAVRQNNRPEQHEMEDPQASTRRRLLRHIDARNADFVRQFQGQEAEMRRIAQEVAALRAASQQQQQQPAAPRAVAGLQTTPKEEQAQKQKQKKAQRGGLREVWVQRRDDRRQVVLDGLTAAVIVASLIVQVLIMASYFYGGV